jgi:hypothetical protein
MPADFANAMIRLAEVAQRAFVSYDLPVPLEQPKVRNASWMSARFLSPMHLAKTGACSLSWFIEIAGGQTCHTLA